MDFYDNFNNAFARKFGWGGDAETQAQIRQAQLDNLKAPFSNSGIMDYYGGNHKGDAWFSLQDDPQLRKQVRIIMQNDSSYEGRRKNITNLLDMYLKNSKIGSEASAKKEEASKAPESKTEDDSETITFTINAGEPYGGFGQKIVDLGLATDKGLWGSDGDVAFYTQQLYDQGALDANGNLKIGTPIKLKRRKV